MGRELAYYEHIFMREVAAMMPYTASCACASVGQCAHQASSRASYGFQCSAFFSALHFFCFCFFTGQVSPQEARV